MLKNKSILIVDDDKLLSSSLKLVLDEEGYTSVVANKGQAAAEEIKKRFFNVVILDLMLPDINGIELLRAFNKEYPQTCFIIFTGFASLPTAIEALKAGAYDYIIKPFNVEHFKLVLERGISKQELVIKNRELLLDLEKEKYKLEVIIKACNEIAAIFNLDILGEVVTAKAIQILEAEKASLMIVDEKSGDLVLKGSQGLDKEKVTPRMKIGQLIAGWVAKEGEALLVKDIDDDPRFKVFAKVVKTYKTKSFISLPLRGNGKVIGVMNVTDKLAEMKIFTDDDLRHLSLIAYQTVAQIENIRLCEKLASLAVTDPLTGLFNHRYFQEQLNLEIMRSSRYEYPLSLIMFDIDFFKTYNDRYGHLAGDRILKQIAGLIKEYIRSVDIVCRYGGDEFMVILPNTKIDGAMLVSEKIRRAIEKKDFLFSDNDKPAKVTISGGLVSYKKNWGSGVFVAHADEALYKAKSQGRNMIKE